MSIQRAPKQWLLTKTETLTSFESWKSNLLYVLSLDHNFSEFLTPNFTWQKKNPTDPFRGLSDEATSEEKKVGKTKAQKLVHLELFLGHIANYCPIIARNTIINKSTSLNTIWQSIRQHFGLQSSGSNLLNLMSIKLESDEKPEDLYQRLMAFIDDNLITSTSGLKHHGELLLNDEEMSPTMENIIVIIWLHLIHPGLPGIVKQKYGSLLRDQTIASLKVEISQALESLLDELRSMDDAKVLRTNMSNISFSKFSNSKFRNNSGKSQFNKARTKSCILCKTAGRSGYNSHFLSQCTFLPNEDKFMFGKSRMVNESEVDNEDDIQPYIGEDGYEEDEYSPSNSNGRRVSVSEGNVDDQQTCLARKVNVVQSPFLFAFFKEKSLKLTLDSGATTNMIKESYARNIGIPILPATQKATQADGVSNLKVIGEVHVNVMRGNKSFKLDALVVQSLDVECLAGCPFLMFNDITIRMSRRQIIIGDDEVIQYDQIDKCNPVIRRTQAYVVKCSEKNVLLPEEYMEITVPFKGTDGKPVMIEPRLDSRVGKQLESNKMWPRPQELPIVNNRISIYNDTQQPITVPKNDHFCNIRVITSIDSNQSVSHIADGIDNVNKHESCTYTEIKIDDDSPLDSKYRKLFNEVNKKYCYVFNSKPSLYNGKSGKIEGRVNMGQVLPPQRKGRMPSYTHEKMCILQDEFDSLEKMGIFAKPEQLDISVEYINLSFLIKKPDGTYRLVTSFNEVGSYSKPQPSLMPKIEDVLQRAATWKYLCQTDLTKAFFQIPLHRGSMKYCGVATPFKGVRVYTRCAMGMPGSETMLEELMNRIFGDLVQRGSVMKIADNLFCGGGTVEAVLQIWEEVLSRLNANNLKLSARQTKICPYKTVILGWIWSMGTIQASPHRISALATVLPPKTVKGVRSFIGAYKAISRVLKGYADILDPLDKCVAGRESNELIKWDENLMAAFSNAQKSLQSCEILTLPKPEDHLQLRTDGALSKLGIGATLFVIRDKPYIAGFFNAKLKGSQLGWLPCEIEALAIGSAIQHFAPYILQSNHKLQVLTDNKPCIQAHNKLKRGCFSNSARVSTYLSVTSRYQVELSHIAGKDNISSDFESRYPNACDGESCQICKFVQELEECVVRASGSTHIDNLITNMPFTNRGTWKAFQVECQDLRKVFAFLSQGTRPGRKQTKIKDVKRYLRSVTISPKDNLLVVDEKLPFQPPRERIVVPKTIVEALCTALHIKLHHPSKFQMNRLVSRYFYSLDLDKVIQRTVDVCHVCNSLKQVQHFAQSQSTSNPPSRVAARFAADVMKRYGQLTLVLRETVTSFTWTTFVSSEKGPDLCEGLIILCSEVCCLAVHDISIRVDNAPGLMALLGNSLLEKYRIKLDPGETKNKNKCAVVDVAIKELGLELLKLSPEGGPFSKGTLAVATANLNHRVRQDGLSSYEMWTQRDQISGEQLSIDDQAVIKNQNEKRKSNHDHSIKSKAHGHDYPPLYNICQGDLVYIRSDGNKYKARDKYLVVNIVNDKCTLRKFSKNQINSKLITVKVSECFPIINEVGVCQDFDNQSSGSDSDCDYYFESEGVNQNECHDIIHQSSNNDEGTRSIINDMNGEGTTYKPSKIDAQQPRRSNRLNKGKRPFHLSPDVWYYQEDDSWDLEEEEEES